MNVNANYATVRETKFSTDNDSNASSAIATECAKLALEKKAHDIVILDVSKLTTYTNYFVVAAAPSDRQVQAIARHIDAQMRANNIRPLGIEGAAEGHWILLDYGDVIVHVFTDAARRYYDLDGLWTDAPKTYVSDGPIH